MTYFDCKFGYNKNTFFRIQDVKSESVSIIGTKIAKPRQYVHNTDSNTHLWWEPNQRKTVIDCSLYFQHFSEWTLKYSQNFICIVYLPVSMVYGYMHVTYIRTVLSSVCGVIKSRYFYLKIKLKLFSFNEMRHSKNHVENLNWCNIEWRILLYVEHQLFCK